MSFAYWYKKKIQANTLNSKGREFTTFQFFLLFSCHFKWQPYFKCVCDSGLISPLSPQILKHETLGRNFTLFFLNLPSNQNRFISLWIICWLQAYLKDIEGSFPDCFSSIQFSGSVVSNSLWPHESQCARFLCPSPTPGVYSNSCPLSRWCHPAISSIVIPFSSWPNPSQHQGLFQWVNSSHEVAKVLEFQLQHQSFQWTLRTYLLQNGLVGSLCSPRLSRVFSNTTVQKHQLFGAQLLQESKYHSK